MLKAKYPTQSQSKYYHLCFQQQQKIINEFSTEFEIKYPCHVI